MPQDETVQNALRRFEVLIGRWELTGRTLNSTEDNITGWNSFEWMPGGFFLKSEGEITFKGELVHSLEMISYDVEAGAFPARVYSSMSGDVMDYSWDIQGNTLIHRGMGAVYTGTISADGDTITGGWRPDGGTPTTDEAAYDAIMRRVS